MLNYLDYSKGNKRKSHENLNRNGIIYFMEKDFMKHCKRQPKLLFICKKRNTNYGPSFGLLNSATFVSNCLGKNKIESNVVQVIDNNDIDREVHRYKPTHVIIEALWVVPEKFYELAPLHPEVTWIVRIHSKAAFLAMEGIAFDWINRYIIMAKKLKNFYISTNNENFNASLTETINYKTLYLPNIYEPRRYRPNQSKDKNANILDIGCFGAIRPMKNHLTQAMAAVVFARKQNKCLNFHIN